MGLLDSIIKTVTGGSGQPDAGGNPLVSALGGLISQNGGLQGLMNSFGQKGLGDIFSSWVGTGENKSISPDQLQSALGSEQIQQLASKFGLDAGQVSQQLAGVLPKVVDKLTPSGQIDPEHDVQKGLNDLLPSLMQGGLGKLFGQG